MTQMNPEIEKRFANIARSKTFNNILDTYDLRTKSVFDIGCTYGEFVAHFGKGSTGTTLVQDEVDYGVKRGLDIRFGDIESPDFKLEKQYDAIFANNLFEHMHAPHLFLNDIKKFLKPGGLLILGVPCFPKIVSLLRLQKFRGSLAVSHINFFTRDTLMKTVERGGWRVHSARGFRFKNAILDRLLNAIYPHFYVAATIDPDFKWEVVNPHYTSAETQWWNKPKTH
jgi:SAM-dependent methyltransferase